MGDSRRPAGTATTSTARRVLFTNEQKQIVAEQYQYCLTRQDKLALARRVGLQSLEQLYNLANRMAITRRPLEDLTDISSGTDPAFAPARLRLREDPDVVTLDADGIDYLTRHFGRLYIEQIAFHVGRSEALVMHAARQMGLRRFVRYWEASKAMAWLDRDEDELTSRGTDFYRCLDRRGREAITLVSTTSLLRMLDGPGGREWIAARDADACFVRELEDTLTAIRAGDAQFEAGRWVSHGHVCLNPWGGVSFGLFDDGTDHKIPARDLHPSDLTAEALA